MSGSCMQIGTGLARGLVSERHAETHTSPWCRSDNMYQQVGGKFPHIFFSPGLVAILKTQDIHLIRNGK